MSRACDPLNKEGAAQESGLDRKPSAWNPELASLKRFCFSVVCTAVIACI